MMSKPISCKIVYYDGVLYEPEPFGKKFFQSINKAKKFLQRFFETEPDEIRKNYFIVNKEGGQDETIN